jgi:hypothetical protein
LSKSNFSIAVGTFQHHRRSFPRYATLSRVSGEANNTGVTRDVNPIFAILFLVANGTLTPFRDSTFQATGETVNTDQAEARATEDSYEVIKRASAD